MRTAVMGPITTKVSGDDMQPSICHAKHFTHRKLRFQKNNTRKRPALDGPKFSLFPMLAV